MFHALGAYDNAEMTKYVNLVGNTVAQGARQDTGYHFAILDSEIVNAFAMPGGYIFITRGALANLQNEAELAGVLAHEVAHVDGRHLEKEVRAKKTASWAVEEGTAKIPNGAQLNALTNDLITKALTSRYSQDRESEADRKGVELAAKAGYDPSGLLSFLQRMSVASAASQDKRALAMLNGKTHPPFEQRVAALQPLVAAQGQGGQTLAQRYAERVDFTKPATPAGTQVAAQSSSACTLTRAKDRILSERAALANVGNSSAADTSNPCSLEEAKARITEAREVLKELDQGSATGTGATAQGTSASNTSGSKKKLPK
jgi:predicted Zn-dependent protease